MEKTTRRLFKALRYYKQAFHRLWLRLTMGTFTAFMTPTFGPTRTISKASYRFYMQSDRWQELRRSVIQKHRGRCQACGKKGRHVHHVNYTRLFKEKLSEDLVLFCGDCHRLFHESFGVKKDMRSETSAFIAEVKRHRTTLQQAHHHDAEFIAIAALWR